MNLTETENEARAFRLAIGPKIWERFDTPANRRMLARYIHGMGLPLSARALLVGFAVLAGEGLLEVVPEPEGSRTKPVSEFLKSLDESCDDPELAGALSSPVAVAEVN